MNQTTFVIALVLNLIGIICLVVLKAVTTDTLLICALIIGIGLQITSRQRE